MMNTTYSKQDFYRAHLTRDIRFDGKFFVAVKTTGIYCRPVCPARKAKLENLEFYLHAAQAEEAGFRPCLRCRPETAPGSAAWIGTSATVRRAIRLLENSTEEITSIRNAAEKLGIGERWLRELFQQQVGISPQAFLLNTKLNIARNLLDNSSLSVTDIALSAGFNSVRRFNDAFKKRFNRTPSSIKQHPTTSNAQVIYLRYRPPLDWTGLLSFFDFRTIPMMERVEQNTYQRLFTYQGTPGWMRASLADHYKIKVEFKLANAAPMLTFVERVKALFDLDADPMLIEQDLGRDNKLAPLLNDQSGLRIPGCWDGFELAVRAIIGQKISVKAARTVLTRLVNLCGSKQTFDHSLALTHFFPSPAQVLAADLSQLGLTKAKAQTLRSLAELADSAELILDGTADYQDTCQKLLSIKGVGEWTKEYIAMRGLKNPDAFPESDLELQKRIKQYQLEPSLWKPWRAYAAILLFSLSSKEPT